MVFCGSDCAFLVLKKSRYFFLLFLFFLNLEIMLLCAFGTIFEIFFAQNFALCLCFLGAFF